MTRDEAIADIIADWHEAADAGGAESPADVIARHPEYAEELERRFATIQQLRGAGDGLWSLVSTPERIGGFRILRELGRGGMGVVYEAEQESLGRRVALKVIFPNLTSSTKAIERFRREAHAAGTLKHTSIVAVHDLDCDGGLWYCAMELVEGRPLSEVIADLRRARRTPRESRLGRRAIGERSDSAADWTGTQTGTRAYYIRIAEMFADAAEGLQVAHDNGVIHRDIKPANLLLDPHGKLRIVDFGLARLIEDDNAMTRTGDVVGTPLYMSPEQLGIRGEGIDPRTDVYSLGATMYEALTLAPPVRGRSLHEIASSVATKDPDAPSRRDRSIPRDLETIVIKALEKNPDQRFASAEEMARDLRLFAAGEIIRARRVGPAARVLRRMRRRPVRSALIAVAIATSIIAWVALSAGQAAEERRMAARYDLLCREASAYLSYAREAGGADLGRPESKLIAEAIALRPDRPEAYFWRAMLTPESTEAAREDMQRAAERGLQEQEVLLGRTILCEVIDDYVSLNTYLKETQPDLSTIAGRFTAAIILRIRADTPGMIRGLDDVLGEPGLAVTYRGLALNLRLIAHRELGNYDGVLADAQSIRSLGNRSVGVQVAIADAFEHLGRTDEASKRFAEIEEGVRSTGTESSWWSLIRACETTERWSDIDRLLPDALKAQPASQAILVKAGVAAERRKEWAQALDFYRVALELQKSAEAHSRAAACLVMLNRVEEARQEWARARKIGPASVYEWDFWVHSWAWSDRVVESLPESEHAIRAHPWSLRLRAIRAAMLNDLGRYEDALRVLNRVLELEPRHATAHSYRAFSLAKLGRLEEAVAAAKRACEFDPRNSNSHRHLAAALLGVGKYSEALASARTAVEIDPSDYSAHSQMAQAALKTGNREAALEHSRIAIELRPRAGMFRIVRARVLFQTGDPKAAVAELDIVRDTPNALFSLGLKRSYHEERARVVMALGRYDEAMAEFNWLIENGKPKHVEWAYSVRGEIHHARRQWADAIRDYEASRAIQPNNMRTLYNLALVYAASRQMGKAGDVWTDLLERFPVLDPAVRATVVGGLAWVLCMNSEVDERDPERAIQYAKEAIKFKSTHENWNTLGIASCRAGRWKESIKAIETGMAIDGDSDPFDWLVIGMAKWQLGEHDAARQLLAKSHEWMDAHRAELSKKQQVFADLEGLFRDADKLIGGAGEK
ncbi:MAG: protein kinase domain-containing protein [Planctomycetota bacterium]|jgi:serine/threonine protein kinase/Flp pilus assembly protein TadD